MPDEQTKDSSSMNDFRTPDFKRMGDTPESLVLKIRAADMAGLNYVEASPELIELMANEKTDHLMYMGKHVYAYGKKQEIEMRLDQTIETAVFRG